jgi:hypothetical protein
MPPSRRELVAELRQTFHLDESCSLPEPVPVSYYSDIAISIKWLNNCLIWLLKFLAVLFRQLAQTPIQSKRTERARAIYQFYAADHGQASPSSPAPASSSETSSSKAAMASADQVRLYWPEKSNRWIMVAFAVECFLIARFLLTVSVLYDSAEKCVKLTASKNLNTIHKKILEIQAMPTKQLVANGLSAVHHLKQSSSTMMLPISRHEISETQSFSKIEKCYTQLAQFIEGRYASFLFWNASLGYENMPFLNDYIFMEQSKPIQMFTDEALVFLHIMGTLIAFCGVMGSLVTYYMPYDVFPLLFVYDPAFCAFQLKARLNHYLAEARQSYANYWSIFQLAPDLTLYMRNGNTSGRSWATNLGGGYSTAAFTRVADSYLSGVGDDGRGARNSLSGAQHRLQGLTTYRWRPSLPQERSHDNKQLAVCHYAPAEFDPLGPRSTVRSYEENSRHLHRISGQVLSLRDDQYEQFIPDARSQPLRELMLTIYPSLASVACICLSLFLALLFVIFVGFNSATSQLNKELKLFLTDGVAPDGLNTSMLKAATECNGDLERLWWRPDGNNGKNNNTDGLRMSTPTEVVRTSLVNHLGAHLGRLSGWPAAMADGEWLAERTRGVIAALAPVDEPHMFQWTMPMLASVLAATLCILYLSIFFISICDLLFWLFSVRVKLHICRILLRYYSGEQQEAAGQWQPNSRRGDTDAVGGGQLVLDNDDRPRCWLDCRDRRTGPANRRPFVLGEFVPASLLDDELPFCDEEIEVDNGPTPTCALNIGVTQVIRYAFVNRTQRNRVCAWYAKKLILADYSFKWGGEAFSVARKTSCDNNSSSHSGSNNTNNNPPHSAINAEHQRPSDTFLTSAYLEFRLFLEQIDSCRQSINVITAYGTIHSVNILTSSLFTNQIRSRAGFLVGGYLLVNMCLISASLFQSQCTKLIPPIYSILASSLKANKAIRHLAILWQRSLNDLVGPRSKFCFQVLSVRISYAAALQFNFGITSLYLLTVDRFKLFSA